MNLDKKWSRFTALKSLTRAHILDDFPPLIYQLYTAGTPVDKAAFDDALPVIMKAIRANEECVFLGAQRVDNAARYAKNHSKITTRAVYVYARRRIRAYRTQAWRKGHRLIKKS